MESLQNSSSLFQPHSNESNAMKILIVDDEKDIASLFQQKFKKELKDGSIEFEFAFSAEIALDFLKTASAADVVLILSDINMPGMNGLELLRIIKERYAHLNVIMITAYDDENNYRRSMEYGANEYLTKPIDFDRLKKELAHVRTHNGG
jgi:YesN/AraC family two-component response regulator